MSIVVITSVKNRKWAVKYLGLSPCSKASSAQKAQGPHSRDERQGSGPQNHAEIRSGNDTPLPDRNAISNQRGDVAALHQHTKINRPA